MELGLILVVAGAVMVMVISGIGASIGVSLAGQAAAGVMSEDPEKFGRMLPLIGIAGTQGFYGFIVGYLTLDKFSLVFKPTVTMPTLSQGIEIFAICAVVSLVECISAVYQGKVSVSSIYLVAKKPEQAGRALVLPIFVEIYAILGLVTGWLLLSAIKI